MTASFVRRKSLPIVALLAVASCALYVACDEGGSAVKEPPVTRDGGSPQDGGPAADGGSDASNSDGGPTDCVQNPTTHLEIINACTTAVKVTKNPTLPKLLPDGGLPPLP